MTLHLVFSPQAFLTQELQAQVQVCDKILLLGDALYSMTTIAAWHEIYVRDKELIERGLTQTYARIQRIDDTKWVELTLNAKNTLSWL
ncbi:MAG: DsrH like protein [Pseudomonadota bacterium]|jgi:sulfur relay protein TusB/DsrH